MLAFVRSFSGMNSQMNLQPMIACKLLLAIQAYMTSFDLARGRSWHQKISRIIDYLKLWIFGANIVFSMPQSVVAVLELCSTILAFVRSFTRMTFIVPRQCPLVLKALEADVTDTIRCSRTTLKEHQGLYLKSP